MMNMAKASNTDLDLASNIARIIEGLESGFMQNPEDPDDDVYFDIDEHEDCKEVIESILKEVRRGSISRVIWGMTVLCDPRNTLLHPDSDILEPHPLIEEMEQDLQRETSAARYWNMRYHQLVQELDQAKQKYLGLAVAYEEIDSFFKKEREIDRGEKEYVQQENEKLRRKYQREHIETNRWKNRAELAEARIEQANKQEPICHLIDDGYSKTTTKDTASLKIAKQFNWAVTPLYTAPMSAHHIESALGMDAKSEALFDFAYKLENWLEHQQNRDCADAINNVRIEARNDAIKYRDQSMADQNQCALKTITDSQANAVVRSFWRRIYPYRNDYERELPDKLPVEFFAHMATALSWVDKPISMNAEPSELVKESSAPYPHPRISEQDVVDIATYAIGFMNGTMKDARYYAEQFIKEKNTNEIITKINCVRKFVDLRQIVSGGSES
jgi:hypothetical protein